MAPKFSLTTFSIIAHFYKNPANETVALRNWGSEISTYLSFFCILLLLLPTFLFPLLHFFSFPFLLSVVYLLFFGSVFSPLFVFRGNGEGEKCKA